MKTKVIGYIRGSTEEQLNTLDVQRVGIERYTTSLDLDLCDVVVDSGVSGTSIFMDRPAVRQLRALMDANGGPRQIVFTKLDRAFRSVLDCVQTIKAWSESGISFHIIEQRIDTSSAMGRAMLQMIAVIAELENGQRSERQHAAFQVMRRQGQRCGTIPFGWDAAPAANRTSKTGRHADDLIPNTFEQSVLALILTMHTTGTSDNAIARFLNAKGIQAKRGGIWYGATVASVREHARAAPSEAAEMNLLTLRPKSVILTS
jgi:site-specific DNA recombinase